MVRISTERVAKSEVFMVRVAVWWLRVGEEHCCGLMDLFRSFSFWISKEKREKEQQVSLRSLERR